LTKHPKTHIGIELLRIVNKLTGIKTIDEANQWLIALNNWYEDNQIFLDEKTINHLTGRYWYKHKMIRRSMTLIGKAFPDIFRYLNDPEIPSTTNRIEGFFGHLKDKLRLH